MVATGTLSPAEEASKRALDEMFAAIGSRKSFVLEAGAGAGKTYSLVAALKYLIQQQHGRNGVRGKIACITYTNAARDEIKRRIDGNGLVQCDTIHGFCWEAISPFQQQLREGVAEIGGWKSRIDDSPGVDRQVVRYDRGFRSITADEIKISHDDVMALAVRLMAKAKFRAILKDKFHTIFIDEYQDTSPGLVESFKKYFFDAGAGPLVGFFGDHWQQIYQRTCGKIEHSALVSIGKQANFRSSVAVVDVLNKMRPDLRQFPHREDNPGQALVYHTNSWAVDRQDSGHWIGDLMVEDAHLALEETQSALVRQDWDFDPSRTKILMLTHRVLAHEQGYASLPEIFGRNERFVDLEDRHIAFFVEVLEPACEMYQQRRHGAMFDLLKEKRPVFDGPSDKQIWSKFMRSLLMKRETGTVADVLDLIRDSKYFRLPDKLDDRERQMRAFLEKGEELPSALRGLDELLAISYSEIVNFSKYHHELSPFSTKHRVKGAEFENVLVVVGRGWNLYNFDKMLANVAGTRSLSEKDRRTYELNRNLFYVACSRPQRRLAVLFTQALSSEALTTVSSWFGASNVLELPRPA